MSFNFIQSAHVEGKWFGNFSTGLLIEVDHLIQGFVFQDNFFLNTSFLVCLFNFQTLGFKNRGKDCARQNRNESFVCSGKSCSVKLIFGFLIYLKVTGLIIGRGNSVPRDTQ